MSEIVFINIANTLRGFIFAFFLMLAISIYPRRKDNEAIGTIFYILVAMSVICLLYMIFIIEGMYENEFIVNIGLTVDMCMVPMVGFLMLKIVYPGWFNRYRSFIFFAPFIAFVILHALTGLKSIVMMMYIYTIIFTLKCIYFVIRGSIRYERYLKENYSDISDKSVSWVRKVMYVFIIWYAAWCLLVNLTIPWTISLYYIFMMIIWVELFRRTLRHISVTQDKEITADSGKDTYDCYRCSDTSNGKLTVDINAYMEYERPWLVPTLTLRELAAMLNTNRTYLSEYLNQTLGMTFYDYLNRFRVDHACKILVSDPTKTLFQVADESGFNSISTFRRTFEKQIGLSPAVYRRQNSA